MAELREVSFRYGGSAGAGWVLVDAELHLEAREVLAIVGPNGGGKTTLLRLLLGLVRPQRGQVRLFGRPPAKTRHRVGYVPQATTLDSSVPADALDIVLSGRLRRSPWGPAYSRSDRAEALAALESVAAADLARRAFGELSGGQRQRVLVARALASGAELLALDEPTTGIDPLRERELLDLLARLAEERTVVMVTHDLDVALRHSSRVVCVHHRRLATVPTDRPLDAAAVTELFGVHLPRDPSRGIEGAEGARPEGHVHGEAPA